MPDSDNVDWECIYSSNDEEEANNVDAILRSHGIATRFICNSDQRVFGFSALNAASQMLNGKFEVLIDEAQFDLATDVLTPIFEEEDAASADPSFTENQTPTAIESEGPLGHKTISPEIENATTGDIPAEVRMNFNRAVFISLFPFYGLGTISAFLYAAKIPREYSFHRRTAFMSPIIYNAFIILLLLLPVITNIAGLIPLYLFIVLNIAVIGMFFFHRTGKKRYLLLEISTLLLIILPFIIFRGL